MVWLITGPASCPCNYPQIQSEILLLCLERTPGPKRISVTLQMDTAHWSTELWLNKLQLPIKEYTSCMYFMISWSSLHVHFHHCQYSEKEEISVRNQLWNYSGITEVWKQQRWIFNGGSLKRSRHGGWAPLPLPKAVGWAWGRALWSSGMGFRDSGVRFQLWITQVSLGLCPSQSSLLFPANPAGILPGSLTCVGLTPKCTMCPSC